MQPKTFVSNPQVILFFCFFSILHVIFKSTLYFRFFFSLCCLSCIYKILNHLLLSVTRPIMNFPEPSTKQASSQLRQKTSTTECVTVQLIHGFTLLQQFWSPPKASKSKIRQIFDVNGKSRTL